jgi:hypothetical protein
VVRAILNSAFRNNVLPPEAPLNNPQNHHLKKSDQVDAPADFNQAWLQSRNDLIAFD